MTIRQTCPLILLLLVGAPSAQADETTPTEPEAQRNHVLTGDKLPARREETALEVDVSPTRPAWLNAVHINRKSGFELRQSFRLGEHDVIFGVKGPILKKKRLGLSVEVRF